MFQTKRFIICVFLLFIFLFTGCNNGSSSSSDDELSGAISALKEGMTTDEVVNIMGEPLRDIGSGVYMYVYEINEIEITLVFDLNNHLTLGTMKDTDDSISIIVD